MTQIKFPVVFFDRRESVDQPTFTRTCEIAIRDCQLEERLLGLLQFSELFNCRTRTSSIRMRVQIVGAACRELDVLQYVDDTVMSVQPHQTTQLFDLLLDMWSAFRKIFAFFPGVQNRTESLMLGHSLHPLRTAHGLEALDASRSFAVPNVNDIRIVSEALEALCLEIQSEAFIKSSIATQRDQLKRSLQVFATCYLRRFVASDDDFLIRRAFAIIKNQFQHRTCLQPSPANVARTQIF